MQICFEDVRYSYPGAVKALDGVSLVIQPGELVALVGQNGSGKSTLAWHINGLLRPQEGLVSVGDWRTDQHTPARIASRAAYTFQNPDEQLFRQTVWDEVAFGPRNLGYTMGQAQARVDQALEELDLKNEASTNPRDLGYSGRKRVALASALAMGTPILVLDEPTAGLDACEQGLVAGLIARSKEEGRTVVMITHDLDFAAENLERFVLLYAGRIAMDAPAKEFFQRTEMAAGGNLSAPQMVRLGRELGHRRPALTVEDFLAR